VRKLKQKLLKPLPLLLKPLQKKSDIVQQLCNRAVIVLLYYAEIEANECKP
jgi:hypothetical protein